ncbi:MAG: hypothetical protein JNM62_06650 [Flavobacteriales bacterium]|nr:hypothetical protein [Flavobacteriales bacterium]
MASLILRFGWGKAGDVDPAVSVDLHLQAFAVVRCRLLYGLWIHGFSIFSRPSE